MTDWTGGYVADIDYTYGYYQELNPLRAALAFAHAGMEMPRVGAACELGFGQGVSTNVHAAASVTQWHGTDFNPAHAAFAQEVAQASGSGAQLFDQSFADFCRRDDLPEFDFIGLHGIWSWVSDENRAIIVDFIRRKLKMGGVLYISYNTLPGWAPMVPMRGLLTQFSEVMTAPGAGLAHRIGSALDFADKLVEANPSFIAANPSVAQRLKLLRGQNRNYVAHEYFNRDWLPMSFADMAEKLGEAKLSFACSAHYLDHINALNLTLAQQTLLNEISDPVFRQSVRDFMINQQFRRDYWVKGIRKQNPLQRAEALRNLRVILTSPAAKVQLKAKGSLVEGNLSEAIYLPLLDVLADHKVRSLGELETILQPRGLNLNQIAEAVLIQGGTGDIVLAQEEAVIAAAAQSCHRLNMKLFERARSSDDASAVASPVTGGAIQVGRIYQLFLLGLCKGQQGADAMAQFAWGIMGAQGHRLVKEGVTLQTPEENLAQLKQQAEEFERLRLPIFKALRIVP